MFSRDKQLSGLYLKAGATGSVWVVKAKQRGPNKPVTVTLGRADVIKPAAARRQAKEILAQLAAGVNPNAKARKNREIQQELGITLGEALNAYLDLRELAPSTVKSYKQVVERCFDDWMKWPIRDISRSDVVTRYRHIQDRISKRSIQPLKANPRGLADAQKAMRYLSAIMNSYANDSHMGTPVLPDGNPVMVLKDKRARKQLKPRTQFLQREERRALFDELSTVSHKEYRGNLKSSQADFVLLLMITGLRLDEARLLKWENITDATYTVTDTKNGEDHTLPITSAVGKLFKRNKNDSPYLFSGKDDAAASMSGVIKRASQSAGITFTAHDLRRTAATVAAEYGFSQDQIGRLLNHSNQNVTEGYIQRTAEALRPILQSIEDEILANYMIESPSKKSALDVAL
jgi:integrase